MACRRLQDDGLVLLGLSAKPAGQYYTQEAVRFFIPGGSKPGKQSKHSSFFGGSSDADGEWQQLPRHKFA
jgi:hypothetical protein